MNFFFFFSPVIWSSSAGVQSMSRSLYTVWGTGISAPESVLRGLDWGDLKMDFQGTFCPKQKDIRKCSCYQLEFYFFHKMQTCSSVFHTHPFYLLYFCFPPQFLELSLYCQVSNSAFVSVLAISLL